MAKTGGVPIVLNREQLSEQAVRLGAVSIWERQGTVRFTDDFESGINAWRQTGTPSWDAQYASKGGFSCLLPLNAANGYFASIWRWMPEYLREYRYCGIEFDFSLGSVDDQVYFYLGYNDKNRWTMIEMEIDAQDTGYEIHSGQVNPQIVGGPYIFAGEYYWHNVKVVADFQTNRYLRMYLDRQFIDLSAYTNLGGGQVTTQAYHYDVLTIAGINTAAHVSEVRIDNVILTVNESVTPISLWNTGQ